MKTKEKKFVSLCILFLFIGLFGNEIYSQTYDNIPISIQEIERYYDQYDNPQFNRDYPNASNNFAYCGKNATSAQSKNTFRLIYTWAYNIPSNATITSCTLYVAQTITSNAPEADPPYIEFQFREFPNNKFGSSASEQWNAITTSNVRRTEQVPRSPGSYYTTFIMDQDFLTYIKNTLSTNRLHIAFRATDEELFGTDRNIHLIDFKKSPSYNVFKRSSNSHYLQCPRLNRKSYRTKQLSWR